MARQRLTHTAAIAAAARPFAELQATPCALVIYQAKLKAALAQVRISRYLCAPVVRDPVAVRCLRKEESPDNTEHRTT